MDALSAYLKAIVPALGTVIAVVAQWVVTGTFDRPELATAITGILAAAVTYLVPNGAGAPPAAHVESGASHMRKV